MPTEPIKQPASLTRARALTLVNRPPPPGGEWPLYKREMAWARARVADGVAGTVGGVLRLIAYRRPYSWTPERKASRACVAWAVRQALRDKLQAFSVTPEDEARAAGVCVEPARAGTTETRRRRD